MSLSPEAVRYAYRYLLNREPESDMAIDQFSGIDDWRSLKAAFMASQEYRQQFTPVPGPKEDRIGRHMDVDQVPIDITATPEQQRMMLDRIAGSWRAFGESEPHWSVVTNDAFKSATIEQNLGDFFAHGKHDVDNLLRFLTRAGLSLKFDRALDFGCGVGRMTVALSRHATAVVGVDISAGHLRQARISAASHGTENLEFIEIDDVDDIDDLGDFDLIISRIVLQHNPPPIMAAIYRKLLRRLRPGGVSIIQMPTFIKGARFSAEEYLNSEIVSMEMNALPQREIFKIIAEENCLPLEVREDDHLGVVDGLSLTFAVMRPEL